MRRREPLDPVVERQLDALEAAVSGAPRADPTLTALVEDVRAVAPRPSAEARARLDARVEACFEGRTERSRVTPRVGRFPFGIAWPRRALVPAVGVAAAALVALVVALGTGGGAVDEAVTGGGSAGGSGAVTEVAPSDSGAVRDSAPAAKSAPPDQASGISGAATPAPPSVGTAPGVAAPGAPVPAPGRRIERSVRLELGARPGRFDAVTDAVVRSTQRAGGYVASSGVARDGTRGTASFVLRIPAARLDAAVADLSRLAHVRAIEQATQDLTGAYDGTAGRLRDARTQRRALVAAVATATGDDASRLRSRLATATARVKRLERALRALRTRTTYATVDLAVIASRRAAAAPGRDGRWTPADAWHDARRGLEVAAGVLILVLAFALPIALIGSLAAFGAGAIRRRRRDAALDTA
jgi:hypothetical protein